MHILYNIYVHVNVSIAGLVCPTDRDEIPTAILVSAIQISGLHINVNTSPILDVLIGTIGSYKNNFSVLGVDLNKKWIAVLTNVNK